MLLVNGEPRLCDFGTARIQKENQSFDLDVTAKFNTTVVGSGFFKSPEMERQEPNGSKSDVWSFGISLGVVLGLHNVFNKHFPDGYKGGLQKFLMDVAADKHDDILEEEDIFISMIFKDLLKKVLVVNQDRRFSMKQVLDHKYCNMDQKFYTRGYNECKKNGYPPRPKKEVKQEEPKQQAAP